MPGGYKSLEWPRPAGSASNTTTHKFLNMGGRIRQNKSSNACISIIHPHKLTDLFPLTIAGSVKKKKDNILTNDSSQDVIDKNTSHCAKNEHHSQEYIILETYAPHIFITGNRGKKQRAKDSCCSLMTLSLSERKPLSKESFHITA